MKTKNALAALQPSPGQKAGGGCLERRVRPFRSQKEAMEYLRANHPQFFDDPQMRGLAATVIMELHEELAALSTVQRTSVIAGTIALMYRMGSAALKTIRDEQERSMARICVESYRPNKEVSDAGPLTPELKPKREPGIR
jgi:hypothetical protein